MIQRYKRPDKKNAESIVQSAKKDMEYTLSLDINENSTVTIIRNIHECFRSLGDALLISRGIEDGDHAMSIKELTKLQIKTERPLGVLDNLRILRHNINYYGYRPKIEEAVEIVDFVKSCFGIIVKEVEKQIKSGKYFG